MHIFRERPLALACCAFAAAAVLARSMSATVQLICTILATLSLLVLIFLFFKKKKRALFLAILVFLALSLALLSSYLFFHVRYQNWQDRIGEDCVVEGVILEREVGKPYQSVLTAEIHKINGKRCRADVRLLFPYATSLQVGDSFRLSGVGAPFETKYMENEEINALKDGILLCIYSDDMRNCELIENDRFSLRVKLSQWNFAASYRLEQVIGGEAGKFAAALLLGTRDHLSGDTSLHFQRVGVTHILALSGMHVSVLIFVFENFLRLLACPKRIRSITVCVIAFGYLFFTGASPSIARAVLMLGVLTLGYYWNTDYDSFTSISAVLAIMLLFSPNAVLDMGMWLSFVASASIIVFLPAFDSVQELLYAKLTLSPKWIKAISAAITAVVVGLAANIVLIYLQARFFGEMSLMSLPATLVLSIPTNLLLIFSAITLLIPQASVLAALAGDVSLEITEWFSNIEGILIPLNDIFSQICALATLLALIFIAVARLKHVKRWLLLPLALSFITVLTSLAVTYIPNRGTSFTLVHASGGDLLLFTNKEKSVAVDFSDGTATGGMQIIEIANELRSTELDDLILTHYHNRDTYFIASMARRIRVKTLHLPHPTDDEERAIANQLTKEAERHGIRVVFGADDLAIEDIKVLAFDHTVMPHDRHDALLFSIAVDGEVFTYINGSVPQSPIANKMYKMLDAAKYVIIGDTGFANSQSTSVPHLWREHAAIYVTEEKLLRFIENADLFQNIVHVSLPITFFVK